MAEENPHIQIRIPPKPIINTRQQYLFENEKLILGRHGFIFREYPTLKERLQENIKEREFNKSLMNYKISRNKSLEKIIPKTTNNTRLNESKSELNILSQPILRFKNRTDLERICDTIQQYVKPSEQETLKEIRARHVKSIDFPTGVLYRGGFQGLKKLKSLNKNKQNIFSHSNSTFNINKLDNDKLFDINNKDFDINGNKKPRIFFTRLQRLNVEAKKIRSNLHLKTHFKGVESVFINPKQIYDIIKKDEFVSQRNIGHYAYNDKLEKDRIEKRNEYKKDISDLLLEEKEKQNMINTKEFSNYLNNKEYFNDRVLNIKEDNQEDKNKQIEDMNYLKNLAFKDKKIKFTKNSFNDSGEAITDNSTHEGPRKSIKKNMKLYLIEKQDIMHIMINQKKKEQKKKMNIKKI